MQPILGDIVLKGMVALSFLFIIGLLVDGWWQRRRARQMCELARGRPRSVAGFTPVVVFLKRLGGRGCGVPTAGIIVIAALLYHKQSVNARANGWAESDSLAAYAANFQGEATRPVSSEASELGDIRLSWNQTLVAPGAKIVPARMTFGLSVNHLNDVHRSAAGIKMDPSARITHVRQTSVLLALNPTQ